jgi:hypothetical protein
VLALVAIDESRRAHPTADEVFDTRARLGLVRHPLSIHLAFDSRESIVADSSAVCLSTVQRNCFPEVDDSAKRNDGRSVLATGNTQIRGLLGSVDRLGNEGMYVRRHFG